MGKSSWCLSYPNLRTILSDTDKNNNKCYSILIVVFLLGMMTYKIEPRHEISNNVVCATSEVSDQPAHSRSLIRAFASRMNII